ncbi:hypothetical protein [Haloarchaeobius baliensis]
MKGHTHSTNGTGGGLDTTAARRHVPARRPVTARRAADGDGGVGDGE